METDMIVRTAFLHNKNYGLAIKALLEGYKFPLKVYLSGGSFWGAMVTHQSSKCDTLQIEISLLCS